MNYQSIFLLSRKPHPNAAWTDFKRTQSWFWWIEKMKPDSPCRVHQVLLEIHWWVSLLWKTSKILLFKLRLHHCHLSVSTPSSAPSCCLLALSLLLTSATIALPHTSPAPAWISCSQGWSQARQPWWSLSAQDLPAAGLESLWGCCNLPPRRASADWGSAGTEEPQCRPEPAGTRSTVPSSHAMPHQEPLCKLLRLCIVEICLSKPAPSVCSGHEAAAAPGLMSTLTLSRAN